MPGQVARLGSVGRILQSLNSDPSKINALAVVMITSSGEVEFAFSHASVKLLGGITLLSDMLAKEINRQPR